MTPLITADNTWLVWAVLLLCIALGFWAERVWIGARFSGAVVTLLLGFTLSNTGVIPSSSAVYQDIWTFIVPLSIPLLLLHVNTFHIARESVAVAAAFMLVIAGIAVGSGLAYLAVPMGDNSARFAAVISAGFIGGPVNSLTVASEVGLTEKSLVEACISTSNLALFVALVFFFILPTFSRFRRNFHEPVRDDRFSQTTAEVSSQSRKGTRIHIPSLSLALSLGSGLCAFSFWQEEIIGINGSGVMILTISTVMIALLFRKPLSSVQGPHEVGLFFMHLLLVVIGASAHLPTIVNMEPILILYAIIVLLVMLVFLLLTGYFAKLSLPDLLVASNAGIGNAYTAVAMASVKRWDHLIVPAIISGSAGAASASYLGSYLYQLLR